MNRALHELAPLVRWERTHRSLIAVYARSLQEVDPDSLRDAVRAMLHTIIFHRFSGIVRPTDVACDVLDVTFATCGDSAVAAKVDEAAGLFPTTLRPSASGLAGRLVLCFQYKRKVHGIFFSREQRDTWEEWVVPFIVRTSLEGVGPSGRIARRSRTSSPAAAAPPQTGARFPHRLSGRSLGASWTSSRPLARPMRRFRFQTAASRCGGGGGCGAVRPR